MKRLIQWFYLFICSSKPWAIEKKPKPNYFYIVSLILHFDGWINFPQDRIPRKGSTKII